MSSASAPPPKLGTQQDKPLLIAQMGTGAVRKQKVSSTLPSGKHHEEMTCSSCPGARLWFCLKSDRDKHPLLTWQSGGGPQGLDNSRKVVSGPLGNLGRLLHLLASVGGPSVSIAAELPNPPLSPLACRKSVGTPHPVHSFH